MLDDALFMGRAEEIIRDERVNAAWAVHRAYEELGDIFASVEDEYLRERENDVADVAGRVRMNLRHGARGPRELLNELTGPSILIADELTASLAAQLDWTRIQAFAVDAGSRTYHTAILARSLKVPAVVGLHDASGLIPAGTPIILDGTTGELAVNPGQDAIDRATRLAVRPRGRAPSFPHAAPASTTPLTTADGVSIRLQANVELLEDLELLREHGAEGVGLYRSEFMLSGRPVEEITEDAQSRALPQPDRAGRAAAGHDSHVRSRRTAALDCADRSGAAAGRACAACGSASPVRTCCRRSCARWSAPARTAGCGSCFRS